MKIPAGESRLISADLPLAEVLEIEGTLTLDPTKSVTIATTKNVILTGKLVMKPNDATVIHRILFTGIDENKFVGGGDQVLDNDVGLWVIGAGQLDLQGTKDWTWKDLGWDPATNYNELLKGVTGFTRNVLIEGTGTGQSHTFIKSSKPQTIRYVQFRFMGPRRDRTGDGVKELVTGRYAVHFHHSDNGSRGSVIEGCIARDCGNHCFVPHGSHGITMRGNIAFNVTETPFWYDLGHKTNDLVWENNLVANVSYVPRAADQDSDDAPTFGAGGFVLGFGDGNICRGNVVVNTSGEGLESAGFLWPEIRVADVTAQPESPWTFEDNVIINCPMGLGTWQNNLHHHIVRNTTIINCPIAIQHGAYGNHYRYVGGKIVGGYIEIRAASATTNRVRFEDMEIDAGGGDYCVVMNEGPLLPDNPPAGVAPILFLHCKFSNFNKKAIIDQNPGAGWKYADVIDCGLTLDKYQVSSAALSGETIRVQQGDKAWKITKSGITSIAKFAPSQWGTGTGLKAEYFTPDFKTLLLSRIEPNINLFDLTHPSPHYAVPTTFAARWTGKIQPQYSEAYTFYCNAGGGVRLWIGGKLIIDKWAERYPGEIKSSTIALIAGQLNDLKLEFFNSDDRSGCTLEWASTSLKREFIPMSQLYPDAVTPPPPPPDNKPPTANAGADQVIAVITMLYGTGVDPEGGVLTYKWEQTAGTPAVIETPAASTTKVSGLKPGENVFRLTVTDDKGNTGADEMKVIVQ